MKILKKIQIILILMVVLIAGVSIKSFANDYTCVLTVEIDKEQIKTGESVILSINASNIQAGEGIAIFNTILEYPEEIFDLKVQSDTAGKWTGTAIENSITFTRNGYENSSEDQEIGKIVLTAKENATVGNKTISLKSNEFSGTEGFSVSDVSKTIEIVTQAQSNPEEGNNTSGGNNTNVENTNNTNTGNTNSSNSSNSSNTSNTQNKSNTANTGTSITTLPKAGIVGNCLLGAIITTAVIAIGFYIKYRRAY